MKLFIAVVMAVCMLIFMLTACNVEIKTLPGTESTPEPPAAVSEGEASAEPSIESTPLPPPMVEPDPALSHSPAIRMYTSYADMVSFDPATGIAEFDYWEMLRGDAAVDWLVEHESHSLADAQEEVDNYADSEYIKKNTNPQLRAVDLSSVPVRMMYKPDGTMLTGSKPIATSFGDLCGLYAAHPDFLLDSFFYQVIVDDDDGSIKVDQVYWP